MADRRRGRRGVGGGDSLRNVMIGIASVGLCVFVAGAVLIWGQVQSDAEERHALELARGLAAYYGCKDRMPAVEQAVRDYHDTNRVSWQDSGLKIESVIHDNALIASNSARDSARYRERLCLEHY
jgi:hypothetical protein